MLTFRGFVPASLCLVGLCLEVHAEDGPPVPQDKKLIAWAADVVTTGYLCDHAEKFQQLPYDGMVINVRPDRAAYKLGEVFRGYPYGHFSGWWGGARYERSDCTKAIANLAATNFGRLTDNFIVMMSVAHPGDTESPPPGWFDTNWNIIANNAALLASIAKEAKFKGLLLDCEQYSAGAGVWGKPFSYTTYKRRCKKSNIPAVSFEDTAAQVRQRGREFMTAITAAYPDITIIIIPNTYGGQTLELFSSFFDGMLEKIGKATLIDGLEDGYSGIQHKTFARIRKHAQEKGTRSSTVPELYKKHLQYGMGLWIDRRPEKGWYSDDPKKFHLNYRTPDELEHALYNAYTTSDKYVWLFVLHPQLWWNPDLWGENQRFQMQFPGSMLCPQCPHERVPQVYLDALAKGKEAHDLDWSTARVRGLEPPRYQKTITPEDFDKAPNILANGSFEQWSSGKDGDISNGWEPVSARESMLSRDSDFCRDGSFAIKITRTKNSDGSVGVMAMLPAEEYRGKTLALGFWTKPAFKMANLKEAGRPKIMDFDDAAEAKYDEASKFVTFFEAEDGWSFNATRKTIRESATGNIWLAIYANPPVGHSVYCDGAIVVVE
jgi:hypothetical protein